MNNYPDWKLIDSAPFDGTKILVADKDWNMCVAAWMLWFKCTDGTPPVYAWFPMFGKTKLAEGDGYEPEMVCVAPVYWMSLPNKP
jgi:hypothetical protein